MIQILLALALFLFFYSHEPMRKNSNQRSTIARGSAASTAAMNEARRLTASGIAPIGDGGRKRRGKNGNSYGAGSLSRDPDMEICKSDDEFPLLRRLGLYASGIEGDGNCLFRAMSDQLYGDGGAAHARVRAQVVSYMRDNSSYFAMFLGGGSEGRSWEGYLNRMARDGVYGDNPEIVAFANFYGVNVVIYQSEHLFVVSCQNATSSTPAMHIAYHEWEHYSSVRNRSGPHKGLPEVNPKEPVEALEALQGPKMGPAPPYKIKVVKSALPFVVPEATVVAALKEHNGNIADTVEALLMSDVEQEDEGELSAAGIERQKASMGQERPQDRQKEPSPPLHAPEIKNPKPLMEFHQLEKTESAKSLNSKPKPKRVSAREKKEKQKREAKERKKSQRQEQRASTDTAPAPSQSNGSIPSLLRAGIRAIHI